MLSQLQQAELLVLKLYKAYKRKLGRSPSKNAKNDRDWKYFVKVIDMFGKEEDFDPWEFIETSFIDGKVYPQQLPTKKMWDNYINFKSFKNKKDDNKLVIVEQMANDYKTVKNLMKARKIETLVEALNNDFIIDMIKRMNLNSILFYFSKSQTEGYIPEEITVKKAIVYKSKAVKKFVKDVFADDLYIEDIDKYIQKI